MREGNSSMSLWERRRQVPQPKQGPYSELRQELFESLAEAKPLSLLKKATHGTYEYQCRVYLFEISKYATVDIEVNFSTDRLQVAVVLDGEPAGDTRYYNLTDDGLAINIDEMLSDEEEWPSLRLCVEKAQTSLRNEVSRKVESEREHRRNVRNVIIACASVLLLAVTVTLVLRWTVFERIEANNRARIAYNAANHEIDGTGYPVGSHVLGKLPDGALQSMPDYGGDDKTLDHPRTIAISAGKSSNWCSDITVDIPADSVLVVAAEDDSPFIRDHYVATYVNRTLTVCLVDGFTRDESSSRATATLALQVKPQGSTN